eukprot:9358969-Heterocapsa_arctica.AAC.1
MLQAPVWRPLELACRQGSAKCVVAELERTARKCPLAPWAAEPRVEAGRSSSSTSSCRDEGAAQESPGHAGAAVESAAGAAASSAGGAAKWQCSAYPG